MMNTSSAESAAPPNAQPRRRVRSFIGRRAVLPTILCGVATIGASGAKLASTLELLCHFRVQYAVSLLVLCGLLLAAGRRRWAGGALALSAVNAWFIAPFLPIAGRQEMSATSSDRAALKIVSINVFAGNPTPERVLEFLRAADADVIVVLELTHGWAERLDALSDTHPHQAVQSSSGNFGIGLYSKLPLDAVRFVPLSENNDAVSAEIDVAGAGVRIVGVHPFPPMGPLAAARNRQLQQLAECVSQFDAPTVVAGDLNITPFSPYFDDLLSDAGLRDPRRGRGLLTSWPSRNWLLRIPIDHCLVSEEIEAKLTIGPHVGSDHLPVIADLSIRRQRRD